MIEERDVGEIRKGRIEGIVCKKGVGRYRVGKRTK